MGRRDSPKRRYSRSRSRGRGDRDRDRDRDRDSRRSRSPKRDRKRDRRSESPDDFKYVALPARELYFSIERAAFQLASFLPPDFTVALFNPQYKHARIHTRTPHTYANHSLPSCRWALPPSSYYGGDVYVPQPAPRSMKNRLMACCERLHALCLIQRAGLQGVLTPPL